MREIAGKAYAKVNFTLDILDRRPDGYHEIRSIMQTITLADTLAIRRRSVGSGITLHIDGEFAGAAPVDDSNLVVRAARAAFAEAGIDASREGLDIELTKRIPSQAGLGGGSSDAATTLMLVDRLFDLGLPYVTKLRLASKLGSDVPFFLTGGTCRVEGLGEKVTSLAGRLCDDPGRKYIVVYKPGTCVPTPLAYRELDRLRDLVPTSSRRQDATAIWEAAFENSAELPLSNDFEPVILALYPEIARIHSSMAQAAAKCGASKPLLSGSGSAIFCMADTDEAALAISRALSDEGLTEIPPLTWDRGVTQIARTCFGETANE